ncbi:hypothetical protein ACC736_39275, partial [Rhizobium ruizarguesonis]
MVTGSHIPADRNGIKFYLPDGEIDKSDEADITALAAEIELTGETVTQAPAETEEHEAICRNMRARHHQAGGVALEPIEGK